MKKGALLIFAIIAIFLGKLNGEEFEEEETNVYKITDDNFEEMLKKFPYLFVKFYAPWCGHCKSLAPEFNKAAKELQEKGLNVAFGNIDATIQQQLSAKFEIRGYPTVKMFIDGVPIDYESGRQSSDIVQWVEKKIQKKSEEVQAKEELQKLIDEKKILAVYFGEKNNEFELFQKLAKQFDEVEFAHTFSQEIKEHFIGQKIVLFKKFDEKRNDYLEEFDIARAYEFIALHSIPTILEFEQKAAQMIFGEFKPALVMFLDHNQHQNEYAEFEIASKDLKDKLLLVQSVVDQGLGQRFAEYMGVNAAQLPLVFIVKVDGQDLKKFKMEKQIKADNMVQFYNEYTEGKLFPTRKSEDIPEKNEGPVITVVGKQFNQIVMDTTKDVLVKYYAPWCGHCKQLAPIYEKVAETLKINPNIILAEYDGTANENEGVSIQGFPTIIFYPAKNKQETVTFEGSRTEEGIIDFLKEHATVQWIEIEKQVEEQKHEEEINEEL